MRVGFIFVQGVKQIPVSWTRLLALLAVAAFWSGFVTLGVVISVSVRHMLDC